MSDSFPDHLRGSGFDPMQPSVWLAEGFFEYLDELGAHRVLVALENLTSPGSRLGADFLSRDFLESPWMASYLARLRERGTPWQFGTNEPEVLLERHGWTVTDVRQPGEEGANFGRWPWPVAQRDQPGFPRSFLVTARRQANDEVLVKEASPRITLSASESTEVWSEGGGGLASALPPQMRFTEYDDRYPGAVDCLAESLRSMLPTIRVEHVGSTAVPGLGGRRVLDVVIPAATEEHDRLRSTLLGLGFVDFPFAHIQPLLQGTVRYANEEYPVLLYLLPPDHPYLRGWIACRDYLRGHPDEARRYAEVKRRAIADGQTAPWSYQQAKTPYLEELVKKIEREGH